MTKMMCSSNASYAAISSWPATLSPIMKLLLSTMMMLAACSMILFSTTTTVSAFSTPHHPRNPAPHAAITSIQLMATSSTMNDDTPTPTDSNNNNANEKMRQLGNSIILSAAKFHGATDQMVTIDWKADRIVVTVDVDKDDSMSAVLGELEEEFDDIDFDDEFEEFDEEEFEEYEDDYTEDDFEEEEEDFEALQAQLGLQPEDTSSSSSSSKKIDLTLIARTINEYLAADGENTPQFKIAQLHEIEVTTPEFDNVLRNTNHNGVDMFEVYKGFDVIVDYWEVPKKKKKKMKKKDGKADKEENVQAQAEATEQEEESEEEEPKRTQKIIEGKLVGRDYDKDVTMINVKGRIVKIQNEMIESVMLPKAKREKGVK